MKLPGHIADIIKVYQGCIPRSPVGITGLALQLGMITVSQKEAPQLKTEVLENKELAKILPPNSERSHFILIYTDSISNQLERRFLTAVGVSHCLLHKDKITQETIITNNYKIQGFSDKENETAANLALDLLIPANCFKKENKDNIGHLSNIFAMSPELIAKPIETVGGARTLHRKLIPLLLFYVILYV